MPEKLRPSDSPIDGAIEAIGVPPGTVVALRVREMMVAVVMVMDVMVVPWIWPRPR